MDNSGYFTLLIGVSYTPIYNWIRGNSDLHTEMISHTVVSGDNLVSMISPAVLQFVYCNSAKRA